jgi:hypothetical protein
MDAFSPLFGERRGYRPRPGDIVFFACAWPDGPGFDLRRRGPYPDYAEARGVALHAFGRLAHDGWLVMVDECEVDEKREVVVLKSTTVSQMPA